MAIVLSIIMEISKMYIDLERLKIRGEVWFDFAAAIEQACKNADCAPDLRHILFSIRDIPYGRPTNNTPEDVLREWRGTCSGKHLALHEILTSLGYVSRFYMAQCRITPQVDWIPSEVQEKIPEEGIWDVHNFLKIEVDHHEVIVDITWPESLKRDGFLVTISWDGKENFNLAVNIVKHVEIPANQDGLYHKKQCLRELNSGAMAECREEFIEALSDHILSRMVDENMHYTIGRVVNSLML